MANNVIWKKIGIGFSIFVFLVGVVSGYAEVKLKAEHNEKEVSEVKEDIKEIKRDQTELKIQNAAIYEMVKFLKEKAK